MAQIAASHRLGHMITGAGMALEPDEAAQTLARIEADCRSRGARLTPIRRRVLEALYAATRPLGAYDLADLINPDGRRMAPITVYRALDFLIEQGLAHRLASRNAYVASSQDSQSRDVTAFLICEECGSASEIRSAELMDTLKTLLGREGFRSHSRTLEIMGRCCCCQGTH